MALKFDERRDEPTNGRRAKTLQERFGFVDNDLTSATHDALMLWLSEPINNTNVSRAAYAAYGVFAKRDEKHPRTIEGEKKAAISFMPSYSRKSPEVADVPDPPRPLDEVRFKQQQLLWEKPIMSRSYTVGFVDLFVDLVIERIELGWQDDHWQWYPSSFHALFCFEVKTRIPSLGELVRQVRLYQTYLQNTKFIVVSPDDRFQSALEAQGIGFVLARLETETEDDDD
jgi:hypothetical protein